MSDIFTANVFFTLDFKLAERARNSKSFSDLLKSLSDEDLKKVVTTGGYSGGGITDFSYSYGSMSSGDQKFLTITMVSTNSFIEKYFINSASNLGSVSVSGISGIASRCYFMFGVGDSLDTWSGIHTCSLFDSSYSVSQGGVRLVKLSFVPMAGSLISNYWLKDRTLQSRISSQNPTTKQIIGEAIISEVSIDKIKFGLRDLIKDYLIKLSGSINVLVLFPKIDSILIELLSNYLLLVRNIQPVFTKFLVEVEVQSSTSTIIDTNPYAIRDSFIGGNSDIPYILKLKSEVSTNSNDPPDLFEPINKFGKNLASLISTIRKVFTPSFSIEDNLKIVKLLKENVDNSIDDTKPLFIWGDLNIISNKIYGEGADLTNRELMEPDLLKGDKVLNGVKNLLSPTDSFRSSIIGRIDYGEDIKFKYNVEDSNILSFSLKSWPGYLSTFFLKIDNLKEDKLKDINPSKSSSNTSQTLTISQPPQGSNGLSNVDASSSTSVSSAIPNQSTSPVMAVLPEADLQIIYKEALKFAARLSSSLTIRTLPFFSLTSITSLGKPCKVIGADPYIIGEPIPTEEKSTVIEGDFLITGFRHSITATNGCYSEFSLTRILS